MRYLNYVLLVSCMMVTVNTARAAHPIHSQPPVSVGILLFDGVQIIDFTAPYEVFGQAGFGVYTVSVEGESVTTAMGLMVTPDHSFANLPEVDVVLVPGGDINAAAADKQIRQWLQQQAKTAEQILSVCTGSHILASAKLLDGLTATTFHSAIPGLRRNNPAINVIDDARFVDNGKIITSAGLSSGIDAALHLVAKRHGMERAKTIAMHLEYDWRPQDGFVRGLMADRHFPPLAIDWPEHTRLHRKYHFGDQHHWLSRFEGTTGFSRVELTQVVEQYMANLPRWEALPKAGGDKLRWQKQEGQSQIAMTMSLELNGQSLSITLELDIQPDPV